MVKFLWDLNIEDIPCGWEPIYQEALKDYPGGKIAETISQYGDGELSVEKHLFNPVKCREILINKFNQLKFEAIELYNKRDVLDFKICCNRLFQIDIFLYSILNEWTYIDDVFANDSFQPNNILSDIKSYAQDTYFDNSDSQFNNFKFINL